MPRKQCVLVDLSDTKLKTWKDVTFARVDTQVCWRKHKKFRRLTNHINQLKSWQKGDLQNLNRGPILNPQFPSTRPHAASKMAYYTFSAAPII